MRASEVVVVVVVVVSVKVIHFLEPVRPLQVSRRGGQNAITACNIRYPPHPPPSVESTLVSQICVIFAFILFCEGVLMSGYEGLEHLIYVASADWTLVLLL